MTTRRREGINLPGTDKTAIGLAGKPLLLVGAVADPTNCGQTNKKEMKGGEKF
jgi:hypothetical protein